MAVTERDVRNALKKVKDPELNLDLVVLGLVYDIDVGEEGYKLTTLLDLYSNALKVLRPALTIFENKIFFLQNTIIYYGSNFFVFQSYELRFSGFFG